MKLIQLGALMVAATALSGCATKPAEPLKPAVLIKPSEQVIKQLDIAVKMSSGMKKVTIAQDVLTKHNVLAIQNAQHQVDGQPIQGRIIDKPYSFELFIRGEDCILKDRQTEQTFVIEAAECEAIE